MQRFIPAEFGVDHTKVQICDMDHGFYEKKAEIRRLIESEDIPHTYIYCNFLMRYLLPSLVQPGLDAPPRDEVTIFGGGDTKGLVILLLSNLLSDTWNVKCFFHVLFFSLKEDFVSAGIFVEEGDVAKFTVCTIEDPRTLNMTLYLRPPGNIYSLNELVSLWETKINKCLKKIHITEEQLLKNIQSKLTVLLVKGFHDILVELFLLLLYVLCCQGYSFQIPGLIKSNFEKGSDALFWYSCL